MMTARLDRPAANRERADIAGQGGFALVAVIWAIGVIALLFVTYIAAARYRAIDAFAISQRARAEAMANAAVNLAPRIATAKAASIADSKMVSTMNATRNSSSA